MTSTRIITFTQQQGEAYLSVRGSHSFLTAMAWSSDDNLFFLEDTEAKLWRESFEAAQKENELLKRQVEELKQQLMEAKKMYDLDYQLFLLRENKAQEQFRRTPCGSGRTGVGFQAIFEKVTSTYERQRKWSKTTGFTGSPVAADSGKVVVGDPDEEDDPEMEAHLMRLLEEGRK